MPTADNRIADDQNAKVQRQVALLFPFISLMYGSLLPAGLFLYWIVSTLFQVVQQFLTIGWGGMFPLFGWTPAFAVDHTPRFPVALPRRHVAPGSGRPILTGGRATGRRPPNDDSPPRRGRQGRRGRRR